MYKEGRLQLLDSLGRGCELCISDGDLGRLGISEEDLIGALGCCGYAAYCCRERLCLGDVVPDGVCSEESIHLCLLQEALARN